MIWVTNAKIIETYRVRIEFSDGLSGVIDFHNILAKDNRLVVRELLNMNKFNSCKVEYDTLCWENGVDFAPEYLYEKIKTNATNNIL
jgi:uncharacterized protein YkvS